MEKFSQFRDRGSGVSPFLPTHTPTKLLAVPWTTLLFALRLPLLLTTTLFTTFVFIIIPLPSLVKKALLWLLLAIPGIWWIDLRIDGVKPGSLSSAQNASRVPHPGSIIACSSTSPIDALYLAAIFDPIFTVSWPRCRGVQRISLFGAVLRALAYPQERQPRKGKLVDLKVLTTQNPKRVVAVFPECTTTNGQGILPMSWSLLEAGEETKIFPVNLRYSPADVTTPVPGKYLGFLWRLLGRGTHCIRVRIAEAVYNTNLKRGRVGQERGKERYLQNVLGEVEDVSDDTTETMSEADGEDLALEERKVLEKVADDLARLGRAKRVALTLRDKIEFVDAWEGRTKKKR